VGVAPASAAQLDKSIPEAYRSSTLVTKAAWASRLIITGSDYVSKTLHSQAEHFEQTTKPNQKPMSFTPTTHDRIRRVHTFSSGAADMSSKVVGHVSKYAQNIGATLRKNSEGKKGEGQQPGLLNKSMMAFTTIADGVEYAGKSLTVSTTSAASRVIAHRYGDEAGEISKSIGGNVRNVALVYIDVTGVSRKAIVKSVAKGMVVGKVGDGDLVVPGTSDDSPAKPTSSASASSSNPSSPPPGVVPTSGRVPSALDKPKQPPRPRRQQQEPMNWKEKEAAEGRYTELDPYMSGGRDTPSSEVPAPPPPPPRYGSGAGEVVDETPYKGDAKDRWG
jgi:spartin